jgi:hypothetical protein
MQIGQSAGKSRAYLLGVYLGDGCVTRYGNSVAFKVNTIDEDFVAAIVAALADVSGVPARVSKYEVKKSSKPNHHVYCVDKHLCEWMRQETHSKESLPEMSKWTDEERKAFIVGLMDSEGYVAEKTTGKTGRAYYMGFKSCDVWVPDFVRLVQSVGLVVGKVSECSPYKEGYKTPTRFHIKMQSWVDSGMRFNIARKQLRVDRWAATEPYSERKLFPRRSSETARQTP